MTTSGPQFVASPVADGTASVRVGRYWLEVGSNDGTFAVFEPNPDRKNAAALKQAFKRSSAEGGATATLAATEDVIERAGGELGNAEHWVAFFTDAVQGRLDPKAVSGEVDAGLELLGQLDRSGRHEEALRLARDLSAILALLLRWLDLIRSLKIAANSAVALGQAADHAWALHELGSLQLAAGDPHDAAKNLQNAKTIKDTLPPGSGRCATRHNLDSAERDIFAIHARYQKLLKLTAAVIVVPLLLTGGVAVAVVLNDSAASTTTMNAQGPTTTPNHPGSTSRTNPSGSTSTTSKPPPTDTVAPSPTLTAPPETALTTSTPTFAGETGTETGDQLNATLFVTDTNGANAAGTPVTVQANGPFSETVPLPDGPYTAYITQADDAGHTGTSPSRTFTIDTTGPNLTIDCKAPPKCTGTTDENNQEVAVTVGETPARGGTRSTYKISADSIPSDGTFTVTLNPLDYRQSYDVTASQKDAAGNTGYSQPFTFQTGSAPVN